jgi:hypothetical protein
MKVLKLKFDILLSISSLILILLEIFFPGNSFFGFYWISVFLLFSLLGFEAFKEIKSKSVPSKLTFLFVFVFLSLSYFFDIEFWNKTIQIQLFIILIGAVYFLIISFLKSQNTVKKAQIFEKKLFSFNIIHILISIITIIGFFLFYKTEYFLIILSVLLFLSFEIKARFLEKLSRFFIEKYQTEKLGLPDNFDIEKFLKLRTAAIDSELTEIGKPKLMKISHRATVSRETILNALFSLIPDLESFENEQYIPEKKLNFMFVQKNEFEIHGQENNGTIYKLSKKLSENEDKPFSHSLFKDEVLISKVLINHQKNQESTKLIENLNNLNFNVVILTSDNEVFTKQKFDFDKYYCGISVSEQEEIALKLNEKAPTVYFGDKPTVAEKVSFATTESEIFSVFIDQAYENNYKLISFRIVRSVFHVSGLILIYFFPLPIVFLSANLLFSIMIRFLTEKNIKIFGH